MEREASQERISGETSTPGLFERILGGFRPRYVPVLLTYFCYGASGVTNIALVFFEKDTLRLTPAEVAGIAFWLGLLWSMKMAAGAASDAYPILGKRRAPYLLKRVGTSREVIVAAVVIFLFRATPGVGRGYSYWAIDRLGFDQRFLGILAQVSSVLSLAGLAKTAPPGAEATMFAIKASLMNLALSASELFTRYLNDFFAVTQQDYSRLGELMITIGIIGLLPLLALALLRESERAGMVEGGGIGPR